jgi:hypothetical protein
VHHHTQERVTNGWRLRVRVSHGNVQLYHHCSTHDALHNLFLAARVQQVAGAKIGVSKSRLRLRFLETNDLNVGLVVDQSLDDPRAVFTQLRCIDATFFRGSLCQLARQTYREPSLSDVLYRTRQYAISLSQMFDYVGAQGATYLSK